MSTIERTDPLLSRTLINPEVLTAEQIETQEYKTKFNAAGAAILTVSTIALLSENIELVGNYDTKTVGFIGLGYAAIAYGFSKVLR